MNPSLAKILRRGNKSCSESLESPKSLALFEIAGFGLWAIALIALIGWAMFRAIPDLPSPGAGAEARLPRPNPATLPAKAQAEPADQLFQEFMKKLKP